MSRTVKKWLYAFLHGVFLFLFSWVWLSVYTTYDRETFFIEWASTIKRIFLHIDEDPPSKDYLFINLAHDKELIPREEGTGKQVITDRQQLAQLLHILQKNSGSYKFGLFDVYLKGDSPNDSLLIKAVASIKNVVFPIHAPDGDSIELPKFKVPYALADYSSAAGMFFKYKLQPEKEFASVPVYMYHQLDGRNIQWHRLYVSDNGRPIFNNFIVDFPIRSHEVFDEHEYPVVNLSELLLLPEEVIVHDFLKGRIILAGDFENDVHTTIHGSTTGTLILLNTYLTLKKGYHIVKPFWVMLMLLVYTLISYQLFYRQQLLTSLQENKKYSFIASYLNYVILLAVISILSYLFFNVYVNILILALYLNCVSYLIGIRNKTREWPKFHEILLNIKDTYFNFR